MEQKIIISRAEVALILLEYAKQRFGLITSSLRQHEFRDMNDQSTDFHHFMIPVTVPDLQLTSMKLADPPISGERKIEINNL